MLAVKNWKTQDYLVRARESRRAHLQTEAGAAASCSAQRAANRRPNALALLVVTAVLREKNVVRAPVFSSGKTVN
jgi:hypothetical protein